MRVYFLLAGENSMRVYFLLAGENSMRFDNMSNLKIKKKDFKIGFLKYGRVVNTRPPYYIYIYIYIYI